MSAPSLPLLRVRSRCLALLFALPLLLAAVLLSGGTASAATAPVNQCNGIMNVGGQTVRCTVSIANTFNAATGVGSSSVTVQQCTGAIGAPICAASVTSQYQDVVTSVTQCNSSGSGGGGEAACTVDITNNITGGGAAPTAATVNQCVGSADGSGTMTCNPVSSTSGATVTQCNGSGNGGGSTVTCTVGSASTQTASLPVTVSQCNGSANGGGALVTCRTSISNNVTGAGASPSPTATPTATATATPTASPTASTSPSARPTATPTPRPTSSRVPATTAPRVGPVAPVGAVTPVGGTAAAPGNPSVAVPGVQGPVTPTTSVPTLPRTGTDAGMLSVLGSLSISAGLGLILVAGRPRGRHALR